LLYLVSTPIGNLGDITLRAIEVLNSVDLIAAEDTRHTGLLLTRYEIRKPMISLHEHNEAQRTEELTEKLAAGVNIALLTDAGMPTMSDPGYRLVTACHNLNLPFTVLPGPSSIVTALAGSGLPTHAFYFGGFLPIKSGQRQRELQESLNRSVTSIYFESPYRLIKSLGVLVELDPARLVCVARELTKRFEEFRRGEVAALCEHFTAHPPKGEITLLIGPAR
jgi:16S rRNA (cytidine1402-2'-O)-methyltransferase